MRHFKCVMVIVSLIVWSACGPETTQEQNSSRSRQELNSALDFSTLGPNVLFAEGSEVADSCPAPNFTPDEISIEKGDTWGQVEPASQYVDKNRDIKNVGTDIVVKNFFGTPDALYSFMKLVYGNIDNALNEYKKSNNLEDKSLFLLFKGGNVLRIVANGVFDMLLPQARDLLKEQYAPDFKRSDADFSVYVDEKKLGKLNYDSVFADVTTLVFNELNKIREEFKANPQKYFSLLRLKPDYAMKELTPYFEQLAELPAVSDEKNDNWFGAQFKQLQLLDDRAKSTPACRFYGQFDYRFETKDGKIIGTPLTQKPNWIVNSDNRTLEWPWGSNPEKLVKFSLVRSKIPFEYTYEKDGKLQRKPVGGELIDVSLPHRQDNRLRGFLDNYDHTVAEYTLAASEGDEEQFTMKAYSLANLAEDLHFILFDSYDRPWNGGPKYAKRVNRLFFLYIVEMMGKYGSGSKEMRSYLADVKEKILDPVAKLYPLGDDSAKLANSLKENAALIASAWPALPVTNEFWTALGNLISERLVAKPDDGDQEGFKGFLEAINKNIDIASKLSQMQDMKIKPEAVYKTDMSKLF